MGEAAPTNTNPNEAIPDPQLDGAKEETTTDALDTYSPAELVALVLNKDPNSPICIRFRDWPYQTPQFKLKESTDSKSDDRAFIIYTPTEEKGTIWAKVGMPNRYVLGELKFENQREYAKQNQSSRNWELAVNGEDFASIAEELKKFFEGEFRVSVSIKLGKLEKVKL